VPIDPALEVLERYLALVCPRRDYYAAWLPAQAHWTLVDGPLTPDVARRAFEAKRPLSAYFPAADGTTRLAAVDVDIEDDRLDIARRVAAVLVDHGARPYLEPSARGAHVWLFLAGPVAARIAVNALRAAIVAVGLDPTAKDVAVETRPHSATPGGRGKALRLPCMAHPRTGRAERLVDVAEDRVLPIRIEQMLAAIVSTPTEAITDLAWRYVAPVQAVPPDRACRARSAQDSPIAVFNREVGASAVLAREWGCERAAPNRMLRCPAHDDRSPSLHVMRDDERVLCFAPSCLFHNDGRGRSAYDLHVLATQRRAVVA
jgi:hypothetical protein